MRRWGPRAASTTRYGATCSIRWPRRRRSRTAAGARRLDGDSASARAYMNELGRARDGRSELNYAIYHDRYQRTGHGWRFTERVYEVRYHDTTPLAGSPPPAAGGAGGD